MPEVLESDKTQVMLTKTMTSLEDRGIGLSLDCFFFFPAPSTKSETCLLFSLQSSQSYLEAHQYGIELN